MRRWLAAVLSAGAVLALCVQTALAAPPAVKTEIVDGRNTIRAVPEKPKAIIYLFHGSGGSEKYAVNPPVQRVLEAFVAAGYGYAASASLQRTEPMRWDLSSGDPKANPDLAWMLAWHRKLIAAGEITKDTPVFVMGMSNGGGMTNLFGSVAKNEGLPVKAVADYFGPFPAPMAPLLAAGKLPPPTFVVTGEHDGLVDHNNVLANAEKVHAAGQAVETHLAKETALTAASFAVEGLSAEAGAKAFADLVAAGIIDAQGRRKMFADHDVLTREDEAALLAKIPPGESQRAIHRVVMTAWAGHMMRSDYAKEQFAFFEAALKH